MLGGRSESGCPEESERGGRRAAEVGVAEEEKAWNAEDWID